MPKLSTLLLTIFIVKISIFLFFTAEFNRNYPKQFISGSLFISLGETDTYYLPIENLAKGRGYGFTRGGGDGTKPDTLKTRRVPGLVPIYLPLYSLFGKETARAILVILQLIADCLAVYCLAWIAGKIFNSPLAFVLTLALYAINTFVAVFDHIGMPESFCASFLIFSVFFLLKSINGNALRFLFISGVFTCWAIFMRPVVGIILPVLSLLFFVMSYSEGNGALKKIFFRYAIYILPFAVVISCWTLRNYNVSGKFIPLEDKEYEAQPDIYPPQWRAIQTLVGKAWGGKSFRWNAGSEGEWFFAKDIPVNNSPFSNRHFTKDYNMDSLKMLREFYHLSMNRALPEGERKIYAEQTVAMANRCSESYKKEKPFHYYFLSPVILTANFIFLKTTNYLPFPPLQQMQLYHKVIKIFYIFFYNLIALLGIIGMIMALFGKNKNARVLLLFPLLYVCVFTILYSYSEERYMVPVYPFFVLYASFALLTFYKMIPPNFIRAKQTSSN
mgnify:CR=1 FL=1